MPPFPEAYGPARETFLASARTAGADLYEYGYPVPGPDGQGLYVDVARLGAARPTRMLVLISGTHGVEGLAGSAIQSAWLEGPRSSWPAGMGVTVIHALNPYGFAWLRRVTHENVDLNRNFLDFPSGELPANRLYDEWNDLLNPVSLTAESLSVIPRELQARLADPQGFSQLKAAVGQGQYAHENGIMFGGFAPTWCNQLVRQMAGELPTSVAAALVLDLHTGLGKSGALEILSEQPPRSASFAKLGEWFSGARVTSLGDPGSIGYKINGSLYSGLQRSNGTVNWDCVALEFGTVPEHQVLLALRADNWFYRHGPGTGPLSAPIQSMMRQAFCPASAEWRTSVVRQGCAVIEQGLAALADS